MPKPISNRAAARWVSNNGSGSTPSQRLKTSRSSLAECNTFCHAGVAQQGDQRRGIGDRQGSTSSAAGGHRNTAVPMRPGGKMYCRMNSGVDRLPPCCRRPRPVRPAGPHRFNCCHRTPLAHRSAARQGVCERGAVDVFKLAAQCSTPGDTRDFSQSALCAACR